MNPKVALHAPCLTKFSYRCEGLKKPVSGISEKLTCLMKPNFCALPKVEELHCTFLLISSVFIFVEREKRFNNISF